MKARSSDELGHLQQENKSDRQGESNQRRDGIEIGDCVQVTVQRRCAHELLLDAPRQNWQTFHHWRGSARSLVNSSSQQRSADSQSAASRGEPKATLTAYLARRRAHAESTAHAQ